MKKTKIICTMGPNEDNREIMVELAKRAWTLPDLTFPMAAMRSRRHVWIS